MKMEWICNVKKENLFLKDYYGCCLVDVNCYVWFFDFWGNCFVRFVLGLVNEVSGK